ncbi:hypothetical protein K502DRAFT_315639 [Neoconidiobolus thromboides FSU 785]|nr:hypothetical protein K502DRAFT_315639 [Neoconidiobolus thromboides FSU 785]
MSLKEVEFTGPEIEDKKIKVILITNCRNGELGYHLTKEFLREGHKVIALAPNLSEMSFLEDTPNLDKRILNFESEVYIKYTLKSIAEAYPRIDIICVTPSVDIVGPLSRLEPISDYKVEAVRVLYQLNLLGPLQLIQPIIRNHCRNQKKLSLSFFIMNFGQLPTIWNGLFSSCMNSILTLATSLRLELKPFGMDVLVLRIKSEKSLVYFNNLEYNQLKKDPYYNKLYEYIVNKAVISYREIEMELKKYSRHSRRIILNRNSSSHKNYEYVVNSYKLLITYFFYLLSYILPNYEFNFNYFYHQNNPTWPTDQSLFNLNSYFIMDDSFLTCFVPFWFLDWIAWDLSGIGYLHNKDLLTNPSLSPPNYHLKYQNSDSIPNSTYSTNSNTTSTI